MLNRCEFIGNLGRDPEIRSTQNGVKVATLSIGVTERWKDKNGERQEKTEWVRCVLWGNQKGDGLAGVAESYLRKGSKVFVAGKMETRKWQDQSGQDKYSTEIKVTELVMLDNRSEANDGSVSSTPQRDDPSPVSGDWQAPDDFEDDIPF